MARNRLPNRPRVTERCERRVTKKAHEAFAQQKEKIAGGSDTVTRAGVAVIVVRLLNCREDEKKVRERDMFRHYSQGLLLYCGCGHTHTCRKCVSNCTIILTLERGH